jgi:4-diphosphocytidyl-2-C-methyl-D-erythritol kinase
VSSAAAGVVARVRCPAKVNLHLEVLGRRSDGYHEVVTLLQSIGLFDDLEARSTPTGELGLEVVPADAVPADGENLVLMAARALQQRFGVRAGARLKLTKRIPVGGGLGGGSADAAAALVLLDALWRLASDRKELAQIAAELGSDVPFFLVGGLGLGSGRGEQVTPLEDLPARGVVVVSAGGPIATGEVYRRLGPRLTTTGAEANVWGLADRLRTGHGWDGARNDLEPVVLAGWPQIGRALEAVRGTAPLHAAVSGSGSAVFGVYHDVAAARRALAAVTGHGWVHAGTTLSRTQARLAVELEEGDG